MLGGPVPLLTCGGPPSQRGTDSRRGGETRDWLIANNGDALPAWVIAEITRAGGSVGTDAWWVGQDGATGFSLSDAAVDWIEEVANGETPAAGSDG